ncbi:MAG: hypothetical protein WCR52_06085, partial [Bacteroidota bacterium]
MQNFIETPFWDFSSRFRPILVLILLNWINYGSLHAQFKCADNRSLAEWKEFWHGYASPNPADAQSASYLSVDIPVWITYVIKSDGTGLNQVTPLTTINEVNSYYNNGFNFRLCGYSIVQDHDEWFDCNLYQSGGNMSEWKALDAYAKSHNPNNSFNDLGYISILVVGALTPSAYNGYNGLPMGVSDRGNVIAAADDKLSYTIAHELGHYFGLAHTNTGGYTPADPIHPETAQYVHDENHPIMLGGNSFTCWQTGDGICDTPADPGAGICNTNTNCTEIHCLGMGSSDPLGVPYAPDQTNVMSNYNGCQSHFTGQQNTVMVTLYNASPNYTFLRDQTYVPSNCLSFSLQDAGLVRRNCTGIVGSNNNSITNLPNDNVTLLNSSTGTACGPSLNRTAQSGRYATYQCIFPSYSGNLSILPDKNYGADLAAPGVDPFINGVSTFDLLLISKHILGISPLNAFQLIAADADNSFSVTTFDIIQLRKRILGFQSTPIAAGSWRYIPELCFQDPSFVEGFEGIEPSINCPPFCI